MWCTYKGKENKPTGLNRWFSENGLVSAVGLGINNKSDGYQPTVKVTDKTPTTFNVLTEKQIEKASQEQGNNWYCEEM